MWSGPSSDAGGDAPAQNPGEATGAEAAPKNIEEIQEQFGQQQVLIAQLKDSLRKNDEELASKEKATEEFASKLSSIKRRTKGLKRGARAGSAVKQDAATPSSSPAAVPTAAGDSVPDDAVRPVSTPTTPVSSHVDVPLSTEGAEEQAVGGAVTSPPAQPLSPPTPEEETELLELEGSEKKGLRPSREKLRNLNLLRKKLEKKRELFLEQMGNKEIEQKVEQLKVQVEERDQLIQELQRGLEASITPVKSRGRSAPAMQETPSPQQVAVSPSTMGPSEAIPQQEMYAQMVYKDQKIVELNNRILELEANVLDLRENLKEKDEVINARTRAIALMSEEKERKRKSTQDNLDDTRQQMRLMQHNFISLETEMKLEKQELLKQLETKDRKLHQLEESNQKLEGVRYELSTRIADLQSKVVLLQSHNTELQKVQAAGPDGSRVEELVKQLDAANKQLLKNKAQHKNKVKQLTKQIDSLKKVSDSSEEILRLQQRVAELEEDKGNLQLHLVDFDEMKAGEEQWRQQVRDLEERIKQQNRDLDSHLHALSMLEAEKLDLIQGLQEERLNTSGLVTELETVRASLAELENLKVAAEMKTIELEEQLDILSREKQEMRDDNTELKQQLDAATSEKTQLRERTLVLSQENDDFVQQLDTLQREKQELKQELASIQAANLLADADSNRSFQMLSSREGEEDKWKRVSMSDEPPAEKHIKDSSNHELSLKLLEAELDDMRKTVAEQKEIIADLNSKLQSREEDIEMQQEMISKLEQLGQEVGVRERSEDDAHKISEILKDVNEMAGDLEEWKTRCSEVEDRLKSLENEKEILEKKLEEVTNENSDLGAQLRLQQQVSEEAVSKLNEHVKIVADQNARISGLENLVQESERIVEEHRQMLMLKETEISELSAEIQRKKEEGGKDEFATTEQFEQLRLTCNEMEATINQKGNELSQAMGKVSELSVELQRLQEELQQREQEKGESLGQLEQLRLTCNEMQATIQQKDDELSQAKGALEQQALLITQMQQNPYNPELIAQVEALTREIAERDTTIENISRQCQEYNNQLLSHLTTSQGPDNVSTLLEEKNLEIQELVNDLDMTRGALQKKSEELTALKQELEAKIVELATKSETLVKTEEKLKERTEKMKRIAANLKAKALVVQGHEEREGKLKSTLEEKEKVISELTVELEKLRTELEEKSNALDAISEKFVIQETTIRSEETRIEGLMEHIRQLSEKIMAAEEENNTLREEKEAIRKLAEEHEAALRNQVTELEREISILQMDLRNKADEIGLLKEEKDHLEEETKRKHKVEEEGIEKLSEQLKIELAQKDIKLGELSWNVEELTRMLAEKDMELGMMDFKVKDLERLIVSKDMQMSALQDQLSGVSERYQQSWSALEAKLQEREAFIESLEQDLARSQEHERHLEEGLSNLEERRRSLESKYEALGERLQESDRIKEEVEDHEDILEQRLTSLMTSEENLRKKLESLTENNSELNLKIASLTSEKDNLKREYVDLEIALKNANKEIERLSMSEIEYNQLLEKIQHLELEKRHLAAEFERHEREKAQLIENLELDLKNVSSQVRQLEEEKHALMEHCEKLNDLKCNLEEELENLLEKNEENAAKINELQNEVHQKNLEIERLTKEKEQVSTRPEDGAQTLSDVEGQLSDLSAQVANLKLLLAQKEEEVQGYQSRLLQMHFGGSDSGSGTMILSEVEQSYKDKIGRYEEIINQLHDQLSQKANQLNEYGFLMSNANAEMDLVRSELVSSRQKIEELSAEMSHLQQESGSKDLELHQQMVTMSETVRDSAASLEIQRLREAYENRLATVTATKDELYKELIREKSKVEVDNIISLALSKVQEMKSVQINGDVSARGVRFLHDDKVDFAFREHQIADSTSDQGYEGMITKLKLDLQTVEGERDEAIMRIQEFTSEYVRSQELESTLNILRSERDAFKLRIDQLSSEQARVLELETKLSDLSSELETVRGERDLLIVRVEGLTEDIMRLQEMGRQYSELQHSYNSALSNKELFSHKPSMESEILSDKVILSSPDFFAGTTSEPPRTTEEFFRTASMPADMEEVFEAARAMELQEAPQTVINFSAGGSWEDVSTADDGWGWGSEEARLEEEHLQKQQEEAAQIVPEPGEQLKLQILELEARLNEVQEEKEKLLEELRISQVRCGKLLTKLKDFKLKNENLMRENQTLALKKNDFSDLDSAIEEELKIRIDALEKEVKECTVDRDALRSEKEGLLKRIDTLTSANERFMEMKERQDMDVELWQRKNKDLMNQVEALQWKLGELSEAGGSGDHVRADGDFPGWDDAPQIIHASSNDLEEQVSALAADNEQLQSILEEQRNMRIAAETAVKELEKRIAFERPVQNDEIVSALRAEISVLQKKYDSTLRELGQRASPEEMANLLQQEEGIVDTLREENFKLREKFETTFQDLGTRSPVPMPSTTLQDEEIINTLRAEIAALRMEMSDLQEKYEAAIQELQQTTSPEDQANLMRQEEGIVDTLREENSKLREKYEAALRDLERKFSSPEGQGNVQEGIVDVLRVECATLREQCEATYRESELLRSSKGASNTLQANYEYLQFAHERLGMELNALQESYHALESDYEKARADLKVASEANETIKNDCNKQVEELQKSRADLEKRFQALSVEHETLVREFQNLTSGYDELGKIYNALKMEHATLAAQIGERFVQNEATFLQREQQTDAASTFEKETGTEAIKTSSVSTITEEDYSLLQHQVEEKQKIIIELRDELKKKSAEMDVLRDMISTEQQERADTENELNYMISSLQSELERSRHSQQKESDDKEMLERKEQEILQLTSELVNNREIIERMKAEIIGLNSQVAENEQQIMYYMENQAVDAENKSTQQTLQQKLSSKDLEIQNLEIRLAEKDREAKEIFGAKDEDVEKLKAQILERERQFDELMFVKDEDIQNLRIQFAELERRSRENLDVKDQDIYNLQLLLTEKDKKIYQLSQALEEEAKQVAELQELLDKREDELKELIRSGSAAKPTEDRDSEMRPKKEELQQLEEVDTSQEQSELDLALYMLHQRDVRCDELTLELMQLLEERDTLQLRLSSALRINEELRSKLSTTSSPVRVPVSLLTSSSSDSSRVGEASISGSISGETYDQVLMPIEPQPLTQEPTEDLQELANKLSQLHRLDYRRDVTVHDETQQRHSEQMQLLQQRGGGIVVESNYTLSRDVQSPSTVLLNWIWGRSTPRVMHL